MSVRAALVSTLVSLAACSSGGDGSPGAGDASAASDATAHDAGQAADAFGGPNGSSDALVAHESGTGTDSGFVADGGDAATVDSGFVCRPDESPCGDDTDCCRGVCQSVSRVCGCAAFVGSKCDRGPDCCPGMGCSLDTARCAYGGGHTCHENTDCLSGYCPNGTCA